MKRIFLPVLLIVLFSTSCNIFKKTSKTPKMSETLLEMKTTKGDMTIKLYDKTPLHRDNFIKLAEQGYYDSLLFHRVIKNFMVQGGDPNSKNAAKGTMLGSGGPNYTIPAEFDTSLVHKKGALSAARLGDQMNPRKESSGSQFYIVQGEVYTDAKLTMLEQRMGVKLNQTQRDAYKTVGGTPFLDMGYTVFGEVIEGLNVIDSIAAVSTDRSDRPVEDVRIISVRVKKEK